LAPGAARVLLFVPVLLSSVSCEAIGDDPGGHAFADRVASSVGGGTPEERRLALEEAMSLGWDGGRSVVLGALDDRSDVVSTTAQEWFVAQGSPAIAFLSSALAKAEMDRGLYATLSGGLEAPRGKSISLALWQTLTRGVPREHTLEIGAELLRHPSPRVRTVALFSLSTLRDERALPIMTSVSADTDPLVRQRYRDVLIRYLGPEWYSTPEPSRALVRWALDELTPHLRDILENPLPAPAFSSVGRGRSEAEALGHQPLLHERDAFIEALLRLVPELSPWGAARAGRIVERQAWIIRDRLNHPNALWATDRIRDQELLTHVLARVKDRIGPDGDSAGVTAWMAFLGSLPGPGALDLVEQRIGEAGAGPSPLPYPLGVRLLAETERPVSVALVDLGLRSVRVQLFSPFGDAEAGDRIRQVRELQAILGSAPDNDVVSRVVVEWIRENFEGIAGGSALRTAEATCDWVLILTRAGDTRHQDTFRAAWEQHRHDEEFRTCLLALRATNSPDLTGWLLSLVTEGSEAPHSDAKVTAAYWLVSGVGSLDRSDPERDRAVEALIAVAEDLDEHPRTRAALATLLEVEDLRPDHQERLVQTYLGYTQPPHEWNVRSKSCQSLGQAKVPAARAVCGTLLFQEEAPRWVLPNALNGLLSLEPDPLSATCRLIDALDSSVRLYPDPHPEARPLAVNNYYGWGVMYGTHPPAEILGMLRTRTGSDLGYDLRAWQEAQGCGAQ
jgi:hypothetical protein